MSYTASTDRTITILPDSATTFQLGLPAFPPRAPTDFLDYTFDWSAWFAEEPNDSIASAVVTYFPTDMLNGEALTVSGLSVIFWPASGFAPIRYTATCQLTTALGRTVSKSGTLYVIDQ